jgi:hypothetical protein
MLDYRAALARLLVAALASIASVLIGSEASAQIRPVRIRYEAHEGCPSAAAFMEEIASRTSRMREAKEGDEALTVRVQISRAQGLSRGRITLGEASDLRDREVDGPTCDEVVQALALITALKIDPQASLAPRPPAAEPRSSDIARPPSDTLPAPPSPPPVEPPPVAPPVTSAFVRVPLRFPMGARWPPAPPPPPAPAVKLRWTLGGHASAAFAVAPRALFGGGPFVELRVDSRLGTSFRLAAELATTGTVELGPGSALFTRGVGRLDSCPAFFRPTRWLALAPCLGAEGGFLYGTGLPGKAISVVKQATVPWASLGPLLRAAVDAGDVVRLDLQGGPQFSLVRRSFIFETPEFLIHEVPVVIWTLRFGIGVSFW